MKNGEMYFVSTALTGEQARELLSPKVKQLILNKDVEAVNVEAGAFKLIDVPELVMLELVHICGEKENYPYGTGIYTVIGVAEGSNDKAKIFAQRYDGWSMAISENRTAANLTLIG
jgi:hypothetical protein